MMARGQEDSSEIIGTKGKLSVNASPQKDLVSLYHAGGITKEVQGDFWERFKGAFAWEVNEFAEACLFDGALPMKLGTVLKAAVIALALQEALVTGRQVHFTEQGGQQEPVMLRAI
jgi:myo-inositol 2-dehydrogenase / D-chiro-inositol 1-dehydrogenase